MSGMGLQDCAIIMLAVAAAGLLVRSWITAGRKGLCSGCGGCSAKQCDKRKCEATTHN